MTKKSSDKEKAEWMRMSLESKRKIESMRNESLTYKDQIQEAIDSYREWLKELYGQEFFVMK